MADKYFQPAAGTTSAAWDTAANWNGASLPVDGDNIFVTDGSFDITAGGGLASIDPARFLVSSGFRGKFGTAAAPIVIGNITKFEYQGVGTFAYLSAGTIAFARVAGSGAGKLHFQGSTVLTKLGILRGDVDVGAGCTLTKIRMRNGQCRVAVEASAGTVDITEAAIKGGVFEAERDITTLKVTGPQAQTKVLGARTIGTLHMTAGVHRHWSTGTITKLEGEGGKISSLGGYKPFAITDAELWEDFKVEDGGDIQLITFTNQPEYWGYSGGAAFR